MSITVAELNARLTADTTQFVSGMRLAESQATSSASKIGSALMGIGKVMTTAVTAPVVGGVVLAVKAFGDFTQELNTFQAVSGATAAQMKAVDQLAMDLGADLSLPGASAADAAAAMTELAKAGLSVEQSMAAARSVLQLATAAEIENAAAAEIVANALNSFKLPAEEAGRVVDLLAAAANASSAEITEVSASFQMASAVFASAKIPIEDMTTAIAMMANAGVQGSDAGTSLKTMLLALQSPSAEAASTMARLGVSIYDAQGAMLPMRSIIEQFTAATAGMTQQQRDAALATIFGADAVRAANIIITAGAGAWDEMKEKVTEAGVAQQLAEAKSRGFNGTLEGLKSSLETLAIVIGREVVPVVATMVEWLIKGVEWFRGLSEENQRFILIMAGVAAVVGPMLMVVGAILKMRTAWMALNLAMSFSVFGLIVIGIMALVAALVYAWTHSERFRDIVTMAFEMAANGVMDAVGWILDGIDMYLGGVARMLELAGKIPVVGDKFDGLADAARNAQDDVKGWADALHTGIDVTSQASAKVGTLNQDMAKLATGSNDVTIGVAKMGSATQAAGNQIADMGKDSLEARENLLKLEHAQRNVQAAGRDLEKANRDLAAAQKEYNDLLARGPVDLEKVRAAEDALKQSTEQLNEALERRAEIEQKIKDEIEGQITEATKAHEDAVKNLTAAQGDYADALQAVTDAEQEVADAQANIIELEKEFADTTKLLEEALAGTSGELTDFAEGIQSAIESALSALKEFKPDEELSLESLMSNLRANIALIEEWTADLKAIADRGFPELAQALAALGPQAAAAVDEFVSASDATLTEAQTLFARAGEMTSTAFVSEFARGLGDAGISLDYIAGLEEDLAGIAGELAGAHEDLADATSNLDAANKGLVAAELAVRDAQDDVLVTAGHLDDLRRGQVDMTPTLKGLIDDLADAEQAVADALADQAQKAKDLATTKQGDPGYWDQLAQAKWRLEDAEWAVGDALLRQKDAVLALDQQVAGSTPAINANLGSIPTDKLINVGISAESMTKIQSDTSNIVLGLQAIPPEKTTTTTLNSGGLLGGVVDVNNAIAGVPTFTNTTAGINYGAFLGGVGQVNSAIAGIPTDRSFYMGSNHGAFLGAVDQIKKAISSIPAGATFAITGTYTTLLNSTPTAVGAEGAMVTKPTLAMIGEAGPELLVPLHKMPGASPVPDMSNGGRTRFGLYGGGADSSAGMALSSGTSGSVNIAPGAVQVSLVMNGGGGGSPTMIADAVDEKVRAALYELLRALRSRR